MQIKDIVDVRASHSFQWPGGDVEKYDTAVVYSAVSNDGEHEVVVGYCKRTTYGMNRRRVVVWIDGYPYTEFMAADDFDVTGEVLSEIRFYDVENESKRMCRYGHDVVPQRYSVFRIDSLKRRVSGSGVHDAWAVIANISDHLHMVALAAMRKYEIKE